MKSHLVAHFTREGEHHVAKAKHHRAIAKHAGQFLEMHKTAKSDMEGLDQLLESFIEEHSAIADEHTTMAEHCAKCAKSFSATGKAAGMDDGDQLMPTGISRITPDAPNIKMVLRPGMREPEAPNVPPEFEELARVD